MVLMSMAGSASSQAPKSFSKPPARANPPVVAQCEGIQVQSIEIGARDARDYCHFAMEERTKVEAYWGRTWPDLIRIQIDRDFRFSRGLVPAHFGNRGFLEMPLRRYLARDGALLHEIVHIYAPNANRFLAEGLATYLHARIGANAAFPNFGKSLASLARDEAAQVPSLAALDAVRTPTPLESVMNERLAYIVAGSFVGFLIEREGLPAFRGLYESGSYEKAYGRSLQALEAEWRASLKTGD
jgi:hypothetical protein